MGMQVQRSAACSPAERNFPLDLRRDPSGVTTTREGDRTWRPDRRKASEVPPITCRRGGCMRMRMGATLLVAVAGLIGSASNASASTCGAASYGCCPEPCCDAQCCHSTASAQMRTCYKLVYDTVLEKRW